MSDRIDAIGLLAGVLFFAGCGDGDHGTNVPDCGGMPPVPAGVYSVTGDGSVQVYWSPVREACVERYGVYRSLTPDGIYDWVDDVAHSDDADFWPRFTDAEVENGTTYYYAVDAWNGRGASSDLSYELVSDTPRPDGVDLVLYDDVSDPGRSGLDLSRVEERSVGEDMVRSATDPLVDYYLIFLDDLFRLVPVYEATEQDTIVNDIQDFGYTDSMDEIDFAPLDGWSLDPYGVEMIAGHTYVLWTWDDHFAKIRVTATGSDHVILEWAYQLSEDDWERRQLAPDARPPRGGGRQVVLRGGETFAPRPIAREE